MKKIKIWLNAVFYLFFLSQGIGQEVPQANISNGLINATLYLPDQQKGYYRATRFDWSGIIPVLEHDGHSYFGKWFKKYDPKVHESVMGPVEEFNPLGYDEAEIGGSFVKIGVGALLKPEEPKYSRFKTYEIQNAGEWKIQESPSQIVFNHVLKHGDYPYEYEKTISLSKGKSELVLEHIFTNKGDRTIETEFYNHNFFFIDSMNIGPGYTIRFPFKIVGKGRGIGEFAEIKKNEIVFVKDLNEDSHVYMGDITGFDENENGYKIWVENRISGAGVKISCDRPLSRMVFWSAQKTVCPEPYIHLRVAPNETAKWTIKYEFYSITL
ncbi:MAG: hypothetical protein KAJ23_11165 [Maribacter sp.]|nr:hypothetical protein [Maribacter sp.]